MKVLLIIGIILIAICIASIIIVNHDIKVRYSINNVKQVSHKDMVLTFIDGKDDYQVFFGKDHIWYYPGGNNVPNLLARRLEKIYKLTKRK